MPPPGTDRPTSTCPRRTPTALSRTATFPPPHASGTSSAPRWATRTNDVYAVGGSGTLDGDLDLSGTIDVFDVVVLAGSIVGNLPPGTAPFLAPALSADVNRDGATDVFDLVLLQGFIVGNVPGLPVA